jgi:hypothetical protein
LPGDYHRMVRPSAGAAVLLPATGLACCRAGSSPYRTSNSGAVAAPMTRCIAAANAELGSGAEVLRCGAITVPPSLEAVAVVRRAVPGESASDGIPVSRLAVLRIQGVHRILLLDASRSIKNPYGYIRVDRLDNDPRCVGFRVTLYDTDCRRKLGSTIVLNRMLTTGEVTDGWPILVAWNAAPGRFQECTPDGAGFLQEVSNPPRKGAERR